MKCRPLRRRYVVFKLLGDADDAALSRAIEVLAPQRPVTRLIRREGAFVIARFDHLAAQAVKGRPPISLNGQEAMMVPIFTTGSVMKAREKIKKLQRQHRAGDEEAVPVKQNDKMLIK